MSSGIWILTVLCGSAVMVIAPSHEQVECLTMIKTITWNLDNELAEFAVNMYKHSTLTDKNSAVLSPLSIAFSLVLLIQNLNDQHSNKAIETLFTKPTRPLMTNDQILKQYIDLLIRLKDDEANDRILTIANGIYHSLQATMSIEVEKKLQKCGISRVELMNFQGYQKAKVHKINNFISQSTAQNIKELLQENDIRNSSQVILANSLYFKAIWADSFHPMPQLSIFYSFGQENAKEMVPLITGPAEYHFEDPDVHVVEIAYEPRDSRFYMYIFMTHNEHGLAHLENTLTGEKLTSIISSTRRTSLPCQVHLPKFDANTHVDLNQAMKNMGLESFIIDQLHISKAVHGTSVKVDEHGTNISPRTAHSHGTTMDHTGQNIASITKEISLTVDRPFMFAIVSTHLGTVIALGKIRNIGVDGAIGNDHPMVSETLHQSTQKLVKLATDWKEKFNYDDKPYTGPWFLKGKASFPKWA